MYTVNPELVALARAKFEKSAVVPPGGGDPAAAGMGAPVDPAAMGAVPPAMPGDPAAAMAAMTPPSAPSAAPAPLPPATPTEAPAAAPQGQKLKPEQMMQMLDYRLYNMQQQLTAIMNAMGVQVAPESLVLPPGTTGAPPAETALPGGPMAPPPAAPPAADPAAAAPPEAMPKAAGWWEKEDEKPVSYIGRPVGPENNELHVRAAALQALRRSLTQNAD